MIRLFTALSVPDDVAETLARLQSGLPGARWRSRDQLHLTLAFYGEMPDRQSDELALALDRAAGGGPFDYTLQGVGAFGDAHRSHTLWAGVEANERLSVLARRCRTAAERAGLTLERRDYRPHVTLAYLKSQTPPDRLGAWLTEHNLLHSPPIPAHSFGLWSSVLTRDGSHYQLEQEYRL